MTANYRFAPTSAIPGSASAQTIMSVENPAESGVNVFIHIWRMTANQESITNVQATFSVYRTTGATTGGTELEGFKYSTVDPDPKTLVRIGSACTPTGGSAWIGTPGAMLGGGANGQFQAPVLDIAIDEENGALMLAPGESCVLQVSANDPKWRFFPFVEVIEEPTG